MVSLINDRYSSGIAQYVLCVVDHTSLDNTHSDTYMDLLVIFLAPYMVHTVHWSCTMCACMKFSSLHVKFADVLHQQMQI